MASRISPVSHSSSLRGGPRIVFSRRRTSTQREYEAPDTEPFIPIILDKVSKAHSLNCFEIAAARAVIKFGNSKPR